MYDYADDEGGERGFMTIDQPADALISSERKASYHNELRCDISVSISS